MAAHPQFPTASSMSQTLAAAALPFTPLRLPCLMLSATRGSHHTGCDQQHVPNLSPQAHVVHNDMATSPCRLG
jgi:hypothetical protein